MDNCARPAIITKDLSMVIYGRDARVGPRSLKNLFSGQYRNPEANRLSGIYELSLRRASEAGSPGSNVYSVENTVWQENKKNSGNSMRISDILIQHLFYSESLKLLLRSFIIHLIQANQFSWPKFFFNSAIMHAKRL